MLYQAHHQSKKDGSTEFVAQSEDIQTDKEVKEWSQGVAERNPLPDNYQWLWCNEKSNYFVKQKIIKEKTMPSNTKPSFLPITEIFIETEDGKQDFIQLYAMVNTEVAEKVKEQIQTSTEALCALLQMSSILSKLRKKE